MLRDNLVELIEPMLNSAGANPLALTHHQIQASGDRLPCLENPRPNGAESSLTENVTSPFQAEPAQLESYMFSETHSEPCAWIVRIIRTRPSVLYSVAVEYWPVS
jgi:hypothetical protein